MFRIEAKQQNNEANEKCEAKLNENFFWSENNWSGSETKNFMQTKQKEGKNVSVLLPEHWKRKQNGSRFASFRFEANFFTKQAHPTVDSLVFMWHENINDFDTELYLQFLSSIFDLVLIQPIECYHFQTTSFLIGQYL
jgi:hypothetical protein